jgi:hypothetical protein
MLAADYPLLNVFWTMLWFFLFFLWIWTVVVVLMDVFRSPDMGGFAKAMWFLFVLFLPVLGVLTYLIVRGDKMHEHAAAEARHQDEAMREYIRSAAGNGGGASAASELAKLAELRQSGVLTEDEFRQQKELLLR